MEKRRVVITGMGAISPIGNTVDEMWTSAVNGVSGLGKMMRLDTPELSNLVVGEVKNFDPQDFMDKMEARRSSRFQHMAIAAADEAFKQSGLDMAKEDATRCGVCISSGIGALDVMESEHDRGAKRGYDRISPLFAPLVITNMAAGLVAIRFGLKGSCTCVVTACASGTHAIGDAFRDIRDGYAEVMLAGGSEACISNLGVGGFVSMKALSDSSDPERASIPFDKERTGFVMGEGAGVIALEEYEHARSRGAEILGEVVGYGSGCDAHHMTAPLDDGSGAAACMQNALSDAGISAEDVAYINAHGTGTPMNDKCETLAIKTVFGPCAETVTISSTKSMTGHMLGASGAIESILSTKALSEQIAPPTIGYKVPDPECDLNYTPNESKKIEGEYAISNSFGFGGHNATLVFKRV